MIKIPAKIEYVIDTLTKNGHDAYIVGGCVRDSLMGKTPNDFDITTSALPETIMGLFEKTVPTGIKHGTVTVIVDKTPVEVTTFRNESGYGDSRHPDNVNFVTDIKEDLSRRDFTVNAIAYNRRDGIVDYFGGSNDIKNKILRAVGNPEERFFEDALRILRLMRFSSTLNFDCEENTLNAAIKCSPNLTKISSERIFAELYKAVSGENFEIFEHLIKCGALEFLKIHKTPDFEKIKKAKTSDLAFFLFLYFSSLNVKETLNILKVSNKLKNYCTALEEMLELKIPQSKVELKYLLCKYETRCIKDYFKLKNILENYNTQHLISMLGEIINNNEPYFISHLALDGEALKEMGISGKKLGNTLRYLQKTVIENPQKNKREILIKEIQKTP